MGVFTPLAIRIGGITWLPRYLKQITAVDKLLQRVTGGRLSLLRLAGLPSLMLTVVGRKSGIARTTPMLCVPEPRGYLIAGSNFGGATSPVWVLNVRAAEQSSTPVQATVDRVRYQAVPRELVGPEREAAWAHMLKTWPNYAKYAERTDRIIPVFLLQTSSGS